MNPWRLLRLRMLKHFARIAPYGKAIEVGVYKGKSLRAIKSVRYPGSVVGFDSYALLGPKSKWDNYHSPGDFCNLKEIPGVVYGDFAKTWRPELTAFAHIDVDMYHATTEAMRLIVPKLVAGGIIVCDDYGAPTCRGARKAIDETGLNGLELPTGQWVYRKPAGEEIEGDTGKGVDAEEALAVLAAKDTIIDELRAGAAQAGRWLARARQAEAENRKLRRNSELLAELWTWIDNWDPDFINDEEWRLSGIAEAVRAAVKEYE